MTTEEFREKAVQAIETALQKGNLSADANSAIVFCILSTRPTMTPFERMAYERAMAWLLAHTIEHEGDPLLNWSKS